MLGVCTLPGACLSPTQVDVLVTTDLRCPTETSDPGSVTPVLEKTDVLVKKDGVWERVGGTAACANGRVGNIVFVPGKSTDVLLRVKGTVRGHPDLDADRILKFLPHQALDISVALSSACVGVMCTGSQTCVEGICVDPPTSIPDAGMLDASIPPLDAAMDQRVDGLVLDAPLDTNNMLDAGGCPIALKTADAWWSFDEGMSPVTEFYSQKGTTVPGPFALVPGVCKGAIKAPYPMAPLTLLGMASWMPSRLKIAFFVRVNGGSGTFLQRAAQYYGGWLLSWANNQLTFTVTNAGSMGSGLGPNAWHSVVVTYDGGQFTITIDGTTANAGGMSVATKPPGTNELLFGSAGIDVSLDELYLAQ